MNGSIDFTWCDTGEIAVGFESLLTHWATNHMPGTPSTGQQVYIHVIWCIYLLKNNILDQVWLRCLHMVLPSLRMAYYWTNILACVLSRKRRIFWSGLSPLWCISYYTHVDAEGSRLTQKICEEGWHLLTSSITTALVMLRYSWGRNYCCKIIYIIYHQKALGTRKPRIITFFCVVSNDTMLWSTINIHTLFSLFEL